MLAAQEEKHMEVVDNNREHQNTFSTLRSEKETIRVSQPNRDELRALAALKTGKEADRICVSGVGSKQKENVSFSDADTLGVYCLQPAPQPPFTLTRSQVLEKIQMGSLKAR